jgi:hypothetical protein
MAKLVYNLRYGHLPLYSISPCKISDRKLRFDFDVVVDDDDAIPPWTGRRRRMPCLFNLIRKGHAQGIKLEIAVGKVVDIRKTVRAATG